MIADGRVHGGVAHGIANALLEEIVYDDTGNILTTTLADYLPPTAHEIPTIELLHLTTLTSASLTKAKGLGEGGADRRAGGDHQCDQRCAYLLRRLDRRDAGDAAAHPRGAARSGGAGMSKVDDHAHHQRPRARHRVEPRRTLVDAIRDECGQTGTHIGCEHGVCGACTVLVDGEPVRACLMFAVQAEGKEIRTVEGLADGDELHPLQRAFIDHHGLQCGFCTPGFLMLAAGVLEREPDISDEDLLDVLSSNLCRCTGYQNIIKAVRAAAPRCGGR